MSNKTQIIVTVLGGWFGLHKYMDKKIGIGILYTCTFGLFGIGWIIDIISSLTSPPLFSTSNSSSSEAPPSQILDDGHRLESFHAAGSSYYLDNIRKLAQCNPEWKSKNSTILKHGHSNKRIYRYSYINKPVKLIEEPNNANDPNAIMILIAGELVGYVPREYCLHFKNILRNHQIDYISSFIGGGEYKTINEDGSIHKDLHDISVNIKISYS